MKVKYEGIEFDSELEYEYFKHLQEGIKKGEILDFIYHPSQIPNLVGKRSYTPDFIVWYENKVEVIETKGWNQFTYRIDDAIHQAMLSKDEEWLREYVTDNSDYTQSLMTIDSEVVYKKIKYLKAHGWVDYDFKNPNTLANQRKEKINNLQAEIKELRQFKKDTIRYFSLHNKTKLTAKQKEFIGKYLSGFYEEN